MSDHFIEFEVSRTVNGGLILKASEDRGNFEVFLPISQMSRSNKAKLESSDLSCLCIKARHLSDSSLGRLPVYTQRGGYEIGKEYSFRFTVETEEKFYLVGNDDCEYPVAKSPWEKGPKYIPYEFGAIIDCRVISIQNGSPSLERVNVVNRYYMEVEKLVSNHLVVRKTFLNWIDNPSGELRTQLKRDYEDKNANWVFTYIKLLDEHLYVLFENYDFIGARVIIESALEIEHWIISSGFLITQGNYLRGKTSFIAEANLKRWNSYLTWLEILQNVELTNQTLLSIITFLEAATFPFESNTLAVDVTDKVRLLNFILRFQIPEVLNIDIVELLVATIQNKSLFRFTAFVKQVLYPLSDRRKHYRYKLFAQHSNMTYDEFIDNRDLRHFIRLTQFDMLLNKERGNHTEVDLQLADTKLLEAELCSDRLEKQKIAQDSYEVLDARKPMKNDFSCAETRKQWSRWKNIILGRHCEFLAYYSDNIDARLALLENAKNHYVRGLYKRGYLILYYLQYYKYIHEVEDQESENMREDAKKLMVSFERCLEYSHIYPIVKEFYDMFCILSFLGNETTESYASLLSHIRVRMNSTGFDILNCASLARLVLANNLLLSLKQGENSFFLAEIKQLIIEKEVSLPIVEEMTDDPEGEETHLLFSEEVQNLELKGSLHFDIKRFINTGEKHKKDEVTNGILKTVVGMLNMTGGTIILGVLECSKFTRDKEISSLQGLGAVFVKERILLGMQVDCKLLNGDIDLLMRHLNDLMRERIISSAPSYVQMRPEVVCDKTILCMNVKPYPGFEGVCLDKSEYYIRVNNETVTISAPEFIKLRMGRVHEFKNLPDTSSLI